MSPREVITSDKRLWKIVVLSEGITKEPSRKRVSERTRIVRRYDTVLLEAPDSDSALTAAKAYVDSTLPPEAKWEAITPLSAANFVLPLTVEDLAI